MLFRLRAEANSDEIIQVAHFQFGHALSIRRDPTWGQGG